MMPRQPDENPASEKSLDAYEPSPVIRDVHAEGSIARTIEQQTAKLPSEVFLFAAFGAMGLSLLLHLNGRRDASQFVGMWAPAMLSMGIYNKIVKSIRPR